MPKRILLTAMLSALLVPDVFSQSFSVEATSVSISYSEHMYRLNHIYAANTRHINWSVVDSDFPPDWLAGTAFCDYSFCYTADQLYPSGTILDCYFPDTDEIGIGYGFNFDQVRSTGTYYIRLRLIDVDDPSSIVDETYEITNGSPKQSGAVSMFKTSLFPNPARNSVTISNTLEMNANNVTIYNVMGATVLDLPCHIGDNIINISSLPAGFYAVELKSTRGEVIRREKLVCEK